MPKHKLFARIVTSKVDKSIIFQQRQKTGEMKAGRWGSAVSEVFFNFGDYKVQLKNKLIFFEIFSQVPLSAVLNFCT